MKGGVAPLCFPPSGGGGPFFALQDTVLGVCAIQYSHPSCCFEGVARCFSFLVSCSCCRSWVGDGLVVGRLLTSLVDGNPFGRPSDTCQSRRTGSEVRSPLKPSNHLLGELARTSR